MTFLTPIALFGLIAAAIPILLHIFNLRKLKKIEFSTLSFLKELQKTKIHRLKIRQLLLLVIRTLLIILIVLAFSRPTLKGSIPGGLSEQAKTTAVILFDDSQSLTASDEHGELLRQGKESAIGIVNLLKDGDESYLVKLSDAIAENNKETAAGQRDFSAIRRSISEISPSYIHRTIEDGIRYCAHIISASRNFNKEVYVISDFQSGSLESPGKISKAPEQIFPARTQVFLIPLGHENLNNIAIKSIEIPNTIFDVNKPFDLKIGLANYGESNVQNHLVSIYMDGIPVAQKGVDINAGQSVESEFSIVPRHTGYIEGIVKLEDDDLEFDNKRYFLVNIPDELKVLLIGNPSELEFLKLALAARQTDTSTSLKIKVTNWDKFSPLHLNNTDVAVIVNPGEMTQGQAATLKSFLENGGGILIFPGSQSTVTGFNTNVSAILGYRTDATAESQSYARQTSKSFVEFDKIDFRHPIFSGMFDNSDKKFPRANNQPVLESPRITMSLHFLPTARSKPIIALTDGSPFLLEEQTGNGRVLMVSVPPGTEWSDLPLKGLFVPLVHRAISYLAQEPAVSHSLLVAEEKSCRLRAAIPARLFVKKPDGSKTLISAQQFTSDRILHFGGTDIPGIYEIHSADAKLDEFAVNTDPRESDTAPSEEIRRLNMLERLGILSNAVHSIDQTLDIQRTVVESRLGSELWKQFLILAIIIAVIEMFVARDTRRSLVSSTKQTGLG